MHTAGLKNEEYVSKLQISGSNAIKQKNEAGVNLFESSDLTDGVIPGKLVRPKYNESELVKAIDTRIFELIPQEVPQGPATVLRSIYEEALDEIDALNQDKVDLENQVNQLSSTISSLNTTIENLRIQLDGEILKASVAENQAQISAETVADTTSDLSNAVQNATQEAIQRVSLTARNQALKEQLSGVYKQVAGLEDQLTGALAQRAQQQAQQARTATAVAAGAELLGDEVIIKNLQEGGAKDISITSNHKGGTGSIRFEGGEKFEIENLGKDTVNVTISFRNDAKNFLKTSSTRISVPAGQKKRVTFTINTNWWKGVKPKSRIFAKAKTYNGTVTFKSSTGDEQTFSATLRKNVKS